MIDSSGVQTEVGDPELDDGPEPADAGVVEPNGAKVPAPTEAKVAEPNGTRVVEPNGTRVAEANGPGSWSPTGPTDQGGGSNGPRLSPRRGLRWRWHRPPRPRSPTPRGQARDRSG